MKRLKKWSDLNKMNENEDKNFIPYIGTIEDDDILRNLLLKNPNVEKALSSIEWAFLHGKKVDIIAVSSKPFNVIVTDGNREFELDKKKWEVVKKLGKARKEISEFYNKRESMKRFSGDTKPKNELEREQNKSHAPLNKGGSSPYANKINSDILGGKTFKPKKHYQKRIYKIDKEEQTINTKKNRTEVTNEKNIQIIGNVAKFPKDVDSSTAYSYMKNLKNPKLNKKDVWYLMVEKQNNELQMIRFQQKEDMLDLGQFVDGLKKFYINKYKKNEKLVSYLEKMEVGRDKHGLIAGVRNIPNIKIGDKKMIQIVTEDLIKILN